MTTAATKSVLIVDDNVFLRQSLCELFTREADLEICGQAENGKEAIQMAYRLRPDLIILDLSMPVMNGLDAARVLKRVMPIVPLIMYSGFGDKFVEHQAALVGISATISKSESASELIRAARGLLYPNVACSKQANTISIQARSKTLASANKPDTHS
jgi:two-component system, chemotaxis family, chemotaxis protein CheY